MRAGVGSPVATSASVWRTERFSATILRQAAIDLFGVGQAEQGPGVALGDLLGSDGLLDLVGEVEQADQVGDGRAVEAEPAGELFLGAAVAGEVVAEGGGLVERVQVLALEVLDHRQLADALVVELHDAGGDLVELGLDAARSRRSPAMSW